MKCCSCRVSNARSYTKITDGHQLFETLKNLNPRRTYNDRHSYFCDTCLVVAVKKLAEQESLLSDQNANSISNITTNTTVSSRDQQDLLVAPPIAYSHTGTPQLLPPIRNRIGSERTSEASKAITLKDRPCPKRFKKQFRSKPDDGTSSVQDNNPEQTIGRVTSSQNSEVMSENDVLLNIQRENTDSASSNSSEPIAPNSVSVESSRTVIRRTIQSSDSHSNEAVNLSNVGERVVEAISQNASSESEDNQPISTLTKPVAGPSAPATKNPRVRQENIDLQRDVIRQYFEENVQRIDVNNYSRSTAG